MKRDELLQKIEDHTKGTPPQVLPRTAQDAVLYDIAVSLRLLLLAVLETWRG